MRYYDKLLLGMFTALAGSILLGSITNVSFTASAGTGTLTSSILMVHGLFIKHPGRK